MTFKNLILMFLMVPFVACTQSKVESNAYDIMLKNLLDHSVAEKTVNEFSNDSSSYIILDARELEEYEVSHIKNAIWVGYDDFSVERVSGIDKSAQILVYCSVGYRSEKISEKLIQSGFNHIYNLYGGIFEWKNQENQIVNPNDIETDSIHAYSPSWGVWLNKGVKIY